MYYYFFKDRIIAFDSELNLSLNPAYTPLTEGQKAFYLAHPEYPVRAIKNYKGDGSDIDELVEHEQQVSLKETKDNLLSELDSYSRDILSKFIDTLSIANVLVSSVFSEERNLDGVLSSNEILNAADKFLIVGKKCRDLFHQLKKDIDDALTIDEVEGIKANAFGLFDEIKEDNNDLEALKHLKCNEAEAYFKSDKIKQFLILSKSTKEIALILNITEKTVRNHISNVIGKLGVSSRTQAILELLRHNVIKIDK